MKIVQADDSQLVLYHCPPITTKLFLLFWATLFMGVPLVLLVGMFSKFGVIALLCDRIAPTDIQCLRRKSNGLGLIEFVRSP
jgi:hypothetical protein